MRYYAQHAKIDPIFKCPGWASAWQVFDRCGWSEPEHKCVHGHDRCDQMYPGPDCPYCEKVQGGEPVVIAVCVIRSDAFAIRDALNGTQEKKRPRKARRAMELAL